MSLIFDALRELETQPARPEPFAFATARRNVAVSPRRGSHMAMVALLVVAAGATAAALYVRRAPEARALTAASPAPAALAPLATAVPAAPSAAVIPASTALPEPTPAAALVVPASAAPSEPAQAPLVTAAATRSAPTPAAVAQGAATATVEQVAAHPPAVAALAARPVMATTTPDAHAVPALSPPAERGAAIATAEAAVTPAPVAMPAPAGVAASSQSGATRSPIEDRAERQRIVVSSAHAAAAATPADELAVQRRVATFTETMQRADYTAARHELDALATQLAPDSLTLLRLRAWHALASADEARARDLYEQILGRVADDENAALNLSVLDARAGRIERARERLKRLLARNPGSAQIGRVLHSLDEQGA